MYFVLSIHKQLWWICWKPFLADLFQVVDSIPEHIRSWLGLISILLLFYINLYMNIIIFYLSLKNPPLFVYIDSHTPKILTFNMFISIFIFSNWPHSVLCYSILRALICVCLRTVARWQSGEISRSCFPLPGEGWVASISIHFTPSFPPAITNNTPEFLESK